MMLFDGVAVKSRVIFEMVRKAEQKSIQLQGEVQELAIEEWLRAQFPLDSVDEVRKGQPGPDCVQTVNTFSRQNCGKICYESKRTRNFSYEWIAKLKVDTLRVNANVGVLVTQVMPKELSRLGMIEGIWVCTFEEFKGLCSVLREGIIQVDNAISTQEIKGDKMVILYGYLTGNEFRVQVEAIVEGFTQIRTMRWSSPSGQGSMQIKVFLLSRESLAAQPIL